MVDAAVIILAGIESHADTGRLVNGLEAAKEFAETAGDDLALIFDGAGTQWIDELEDEDHWIPKDRSETDTDCLETFLAD